MSNITGGGVSLFSSGNTNAGVGVEQELLLPPQQEESLITHPHPVVKKRRNLPGNPDPKAEVIALSPSSLLATNRFICEICNKGFKRDQNLQLHRRGHNLPWKLKQRNPSVEVRKRVYVCPEPGCVHHSPARALGDLTGIKKHFCRKHGEKKWKCDKCSKKYAVQSDWKAHGKTCGTKEYKCDCGNVFSRRDSFITHRAFCDALTEEHNNNNVSTLNPPPTHVMINSSQTQPNNHDINNNNNNIVIKNIITSPPQIDHFDPLDTKINPFIVTSSPRPTPFSTADNYFFTPTTSTANTTPAPSLSSATSPPSSLHLTTNLSPLFPHPASSASMSATALLQKAAQMGSTLSSVAPKQLGSDHHQGFMDQFFHVAGGGVLFNGNLPGCHTGFFDDGDSDNSNATALLMNNFGGGDVMTTVDFLGVNTNGGPAPSSTSTIARINNIVPGFSPPI
ncbi:unnamed protein product [Linum trigynum]|uniref:C2H2-type domain-containing protein n=2 Tax=Linum trigynum TaxID=586398 RepID=A0AAV2GAQ5_9ROSI